VVSGLCVKDSREERGDGEDNNEAAHRGILQGEGGKDRDQGTGNRE
jgi:hypothetical protein